MLATSDVPAVGDPAPPTRSPLAGGRSEEVFVAVTDWLAEPSPPCVTGTRWFVGQLVERA